ncbi:hypothetical protein BpHYR1_012119 [Brachionus plicatilis]|uniref:Uncharacterized protein n=1 Tax=Brachionus plicatilis TaxID=10195 RepID=A0A3M7SZF3_BRAPC|nr:hypothetical protein BpHYR1_012119 [Brachionus plicatilis]
MLKKINSSVLRRRNLDFFSSLDLFYTSAKANEDLEAEIEQNEFYEFFTFLNSRISPGVKSEPNQITTINHSNKSQLKLYESNSIQLPVTFIQILIILFVFLFLIFLCKLNQMMEYLKNKIENRSNNFDDVYSNSCFERRKKRKMRSKRFLKNIQRDPDFKAKPNKLHNESFYRKNSAIFKRRSVIYRNKRAKINTDLFDPLSSIKINRFSENRMKRSLSNNINLANKVGIIPKSNKYSSYHEQILNEII